MIVTTTTTLYLVTLGVTVCMFCFWLRDRLSTFIHLIDLVPGPAKKFLFGNMLDFPRDGYGKQSFSIPSF